MVKNLQNYIVGFSQRGLEVWRCLNQTPFYHILVNKTLLPWYFILAKQFISYFKDWHFLDIVSMWLFVLIRDAHFSTRNRETGNRKREISRREMGVFPENFSILTKFGPNLPKNRPKLTKFCSTQQSIHWVVQSYFQFTSFKQYLLY